MKPMNPILSVGIKSGHILWDEMGEALGHVYDHACYDAEQNRRNRQKDIINMPIIGKANGVEERIKFNKEEYCESCYQNYHTEVELKVKGKVIYCPYCEVRRPLVNE